jgi:ABC-type multidrug transport system fused ATPase/permease subunit
MSHFWHFVKTIHSYAGKTLYFNLIGMILMGLFDSIGVFLLIPLISLTGIFNIEYGNFVPLEGIKNIFSGIPVSISLIIILVCYILLISGQGFVQRKQTILSTRIQYGYLLHLREETYKLLVQSNWGFFLRNRKSDIINLILTDIARVSGGTQMLLQFVAGIIYTLIQISIAFWLSAQLTIVTLTFGFLIIFLSRKLIKKNSDISEETIKLGKAYLAGITDQFNGIKDIKSNTLEQTHIEWVRSIGEKIENNVLESVKLSTLSQFIYKVVSAFILAGFAFFSIKMFQAQPAQLMLIMAIFLRLWPRFSSIQNNLEQMGAIIPSFKQLINMQNECLKANEINENSYLNLSPLFIKYGIECKGTFFRYNKNQPVYALQNINVFIPSNQMTAIVGPSGAGKSTLIDLLMGLNQPENGEVLLDGNTLTKENLMSLRRSIGYVAQDPFLFNSSVRENLLLMNPEADEEQIWEALEFSSAAEFVKKLPEGLDTLIGDRGIRLSGGERQRLVLARAILRKPSILFLDEATSALDTENETKIQKAIERLKGSMTVIVIAHRLSTIRNADQVIVLDKGEIVQQGQFNQLANEHRGLFNQLLKKQMAVGI